MGRFLQQLLLVLVLGAWGGLAMITTGCSMVPSWAGGEAGSGLVNTADRYQTEARVELGEPFVVAVPVPDDDAYEPTGAAFDPTMVRLDTVLPDPDEPGITLYTFTPEASGATLLEFPMRAREGEEPGAKEVYKVVDLRIVE